MGESPEIPSSIKVDTRARLDLFKTLGDNTRYAIYLELARSPQSLTTAEIADAIGLHPNTVRPHLDRMRDVGLIDVQVGGRGEIGRPQHRYSLAADAPSLGLEPPVMPLLARMVLAMAERLGADGHDAYAVGVDEGQRRSAPFSSTPSSLEAFVSDLDLLGFDPIVSDPDDPDDTAVVAFANCPFGELARQHADLVCGLHHGLIDGFIDAMGDTEVRQFCSVVDRTPCQVTIGDRRAPESICTV
jgi:predicted ArsR family transcriptional regulator